MTKYIINYECDYADEFDYTVRSILTETQRNAILENQELIQEVLGTSSMEFYFGTNEALDFTVDEIIDNVMDARVISDEDLRVLNKYSIASLDVVDDLFDRFMDVAYDLFDEDESDKKEKLQACEDLHKLFTESL